MLGALLILTFPATLLFATQHIHGGSSHDLPRTLGMALLSLVGILLLVDAWRIMRAQESLSPNPQDRAGGGTQMPH